nr:SulP family inorganic anion transporter [Salsipaludibacter albus]
MIAGTLLAVLLIPQAFAYAQLANLPASTGIAAALVAPVVYALFGGSRFLAVGPVALVSLLVGEAVGSDDAATIALVLAAMIGVVLVLLGVLRLGFVFRVFTRPVLAGFVFAAAVVIATSQVGHVLGVPVERGVPPVGQWADVAGSIDDFRPASTILGLGVLVLLLALPGPLRRLLHVQDGDRGWRPNLVRALPLLVLLASAGLVVLLDLQEQGVQTLGPVSLPNMVPALPAFAEVDWAALVLPAVTISLVAAVTTLAIAETLAARDGSEVSTSRELFALGLSSMTLSFTGGYPAGGSLSRSAVVADSGGRSPLAAVVGAAALAASAVALGPVLSAIPRTALSALIIAAAVSMIDREAVTDAWQHDRAVLVVMVVPFVVVLVAGVQLGLLAALVAGLAHLAWDQWGPTEVARPDEAS